jgi:hypothetical protein
MSPSINLKGWTVQSKRLFKVSPPGLIIVVGEGETAIYCSERERERERERESFSCYWRSRRALITTGAFFQTPSSFTLFFCALSSEKPF